MIHVLAGVVIDRRERVLIAQRPAGRHLAGGWEFPGGKLEPGETRVAGLARELREEIGICIREPRPLIRLRHTYPYGEVLLDTFVVRRYDGEPRGLDEQRLRWCTREELVSAQLLPADRPIVAALRLPERLMLNCTPQYCVGALLRDEPRCRGVFVGNAGEALTAEALTAVALTAVAGGADFLVLREALADGDLAALCDAVAVPVFARGIVLEAAWALGASGISELCDS